MAVSETGTDLPQLNGRSRCCELLVLQYIRALTENVLRGGDRCMYGLTLHLCVKDESR